MCGFIYGILHRLLRGNKKTIWKKKIEELENDEIKTDNEKKNNNKTMIIFGKKFEKKKRKKVV